MANTVHLLKVENFKDSAPITQDVDSVLAKKVLFTAQDIHIQSLLGTVLYKHILALVVSGDIALGGNTSYKTLLDDYIIPSLQSNGYYRLISHLHTQVTDKGLMQRRGEFADQAGSIEVKRLRGDARNDFEFRDNLMITFLCDNSGDYPEYTNVTEGIGASKKPFFCGIAFSGGDGYSNNGLDRP